MFTIYSTNTCTFCKQAKSLLTKRGLPFQENILLSPHDVKILSEKVGFEVKTVPQIWHNDTYIGGFAELDKYLN